MQLQGVKASDIVKCDVKGRRFFAEVLGRHPEGGLRILPLHSNVTYRRATARQVIAHYRRTAGSC